MASGAISAQGSQFFQGTGTGGAITITAISKAFRAEITGTHSLTKGDRVTVASVGGMTEINGLNLTVLAVTSTTSFVVDVDSRLFTTYTSAGTATPVTWTQLKELDSFKPSGASVSKLDKTNLDSVAKEYSAGLVDNGDISFDVRFVATDPGLIAAQAAFIAGATKQFKLVTPNGKTSSFQGYYAKCPIVPDGGIDKLLSGSITIQIDGAVTVA